MDICYGCGSILGWFGCYECERGKDIKCDFCKHKRAVFERYSPEEGKFIHKKENVPYVKMCVECSSSFRANESSNRVE